MIRNAPLRRYLIVFILFSPSMVTELNLAWAFVSFSENLKILSSKKNMNPVIMAQVNRITIVTGCSLSLNTAEKNGIKVARDVAVVTKIRPLRSDILSTTELILPTVVELISLMEELRTLFINDILLSFPIPVLTALPQIRITASMTKNATFTRIRDIKTLLLYPLATKSATTWLFQVICTPLRAQNVISMIDAIVTLRFIRRPPLVQIFIFNAPL